MKRVIKVLFFLMVPSGIFGQLTPVTDQYVLNPLTINPAYAGSRGTLNIAAFYRRQWVGTPGAPETFTLALDVPLLESRIGTGLIVTTDKIGVTRETRFSTNYSYKISTGKSILSFGLGAGLIATNTAWSDLTVIDPGDEKNLIDSRVFIVPDFSFGLYYSNKNYFAGLSIPKLLDYRFDFSRNKYSVRFDPGQYYYLLNAGYIFNLSPHISLLPSALFIYSRGKELLYDVNAYFIFSDRFWIGASYRDKRSVAGLMQFAINNQLRIAYTYDFDLGRLEGYSNGTHEIMIRYEFRFKIKVVNPLNF